MMSVLFEDVDQVELYQTAVHDAIRTATNLGYPVRHNPYNANQKREIMRSVKPVPLSQWLLESDEMIKSVVDKYPSLPEGVVKQLMASTGAGKTTRLPVALASTHRIVVVVLMPSLGNAVQAAQYVAEYVAPEYGMNGSVTFLSAGHLDTPKMAPAVYYVPVGDFLALCCRDLNMLRKLDISCIIVDESHYVKPEYVFLRRLIAVKEFSGVKLLYASATAASDVSMENSDGRTSMRIPESDLPPNPAAHTPNSPAYYSRVGNRVLLFVANDMEMREWCDYYEAHDIPSFPFGYSHGTKRLRVLQRFLSENAVAVVVATSVLETGYTFPFETMVDLGYTSVLHIDLSLGSVSVRKVAVDASSQVQRGGRIGRIFPGVAYYADVTCSRTISEDDPSICMYLNMWSRMFNIVVREPAIARFDGNFSEMHPSVIGMLLTAALPPISVVPYVSDSGTYKGWAKPFQILCLARDAVVSSSVSHSDSIATWPEFKFILSVNSSASDYKFRRRVDPLFAVLHHYMWTRYESIDDDDAVSLSGMTMMSGPAVVRSVHARKVSESRLSPIEEIGRSATIFSAQSLVPQVTPALRGHKRNVSSGSSIAPSLPSRYNSDPELRHPSDVSLNGIIMRDRHSSTPHVDEVQKWRERTHDNSSSGSSQRDDIQLRQVNPVSHWNEKLFPMDPEILGIYLANEAARAVDFRRTEDTVNQKSHYAVLSTDTTQLKRKQREHFLSFLRVHNILLVRMLQATVEARPSMFSFKRRDNYDEYLQQASDAAKLLEMCQECGYFVGIDKRKRHSPAGRIDSLATLAAQAKTALDLGPPLVLERITAIAQCVNTFVDVLPHGVRVGYGWEMNGIVFAPRHVTDQFSAEAINTWNGGMESIPTQVDLARYRCDNYIGVPWSPPVNGGYVILVHPSNTNNLVRSYGYFRLHVSRQMVVIDGILSPGYSGALAVCARTGSVVGMYLGEAGEANDVTYGALVSSVDIFPGL